MSNHRSVEERVRALTRRVLEDLESSGDSSPRGAASSSSGSATDHPEDARSSEAASSKAASSTAGGAHSVAIGADHGGFRMKESLAAYLEDGGFDVVDCGTYGPDAVDYPDYAAAVGRKVASGASDVGIVVDGAGIGSCMAANKIPGVRAAMCYDISSARNSREHNHANVLTLGAGLIGEGLARQIVDAWLDTPWGPGRHARRVALIDQLDETAAGSRTAARSRTAGGDAR